MGRPVHLSEDEIQYMNDSSKSSPKQISLTVEAGLIPAFSQILQNGFRFKGNVECSVESFLCEQFGISPEYLEKRVQTIFLDGKAVDDVQGSLVRDGATLSLSAAMPGLAGAVLRRGGYYAPMRQQISFEEGATCASIHPGIVYVKLFNMPLREIGPLFLEHGILVDGDILKDILATREDDFRAGCRQAIVDGLQIDPGQLLKIPWGTGEILLQVKIS